MSRARPQETVTGHNPTNGHVGAAWRPGLWRGLAPGTHSRPHQRRGAVASAQIRHQPCPLPRLGLWGRCFPHPTHTLLCVCMLGPVAARPAVKARTPRAQCLPGPQGRRGWQTGQRPSHIGPSCPNQGLPLGVAEARAEPPPPTSCFHPTCPKAHNIVLVVFNTACPLPAPPDLLPALHADHARGLQGVMRSSVPDQQQERAAFWGAHSRPPRPPSLHKPSQ